MVVIHVSLSNGCMTIIKHNKNESHIHCLCKVCEWPLKYLVYDHAFGCDIHQFKQDIPVGQDTSTQFYCMWIKTSLSMCVIDVAHGKLACHEHQSGALYRGSSGVGVTKTPLVDLSVKTYSDLATVAFRFFESYSYLTAVTAAKLRRHLSIINVIFKS